MLGPTRRQEYAEATRQAVLQAARRRYCEKGFFNTKVVDIAGAARVSPATVYALFGNKHELLRSLIEVWTDAPVISSTLASVGEIDDPRALIELLARSGRLIREQFSDIIRLMLDTAPHDSVVAGILSTTTSRYRKRLMMFALRLASLGALGPGLNPKRTVDILWYYFGYASVFTLVDENGWSYDRAEKWLVAQAIRAIGDGS